MVYGGGDGDGDGDDGGDAGWLGGQGCLRSNIPFLG